ncbi:MAG: insulinase family protein [Bacteroidales bacterium]|nr:insulinase family protein [Bacteroidales bacterium]
MTLNRSIAPPQHPVTGISLTPPRRHELPNGIPVFIIDNPALDLIHLNVELAVGSLHEEIKHTLRFAYFLLKESSPKHTATEMDGLLDFHGATFNVTVNPDRIRFKIAIPKKNVPSILPSIYEFLSTPHYREENLSIYKERKIKDLEYNSKKTDVRCSQLALHALFGERLAAGQFSTRENMQAVTIPQMEACHRATFCAENICIYATGNFDADLEQCIDGIFSQVPHGTAASRIHDLPLFAESAPLIQEEMPGSVQSSIMLCRPSIGYGDPERRDLSILTTLTGGYFGSRLMQRLREKEGYTYGIYADLTYFGNQSLFSIGSEVNANDTRAAIDACFEEMDRLCQEPVGEEELDLLRRQIEGGLLRDVENSVSYMMKFAYWHAHDLDEREFRSMLQRAHDISPEQLKFLAKKFFAHNNFTQIIVGVIL